MKPLKLQAYQWSGVFPDRTTVIENDSTSLDDLAGLKLAQLVLVPRSGEHYHHVPVVVDVGTASAWYVAVQRTARLGESGSYREDAASDVVVLTTPGGSRVRIVIHKDASMRISIED